MQLAQQAVVFNPQQQHLQCASTRHEGAAIHLHNVQPVTTSISEADAPDRQELEQFVRAVFKRAHHADICHFMPKLMGIRDTNGNLLAVCGLRHANQGKLFLETYLDAPIETILSQQNNTNIAREAILEVGNLAVADPANIRSLLASISIYLHTTHSEWAVFTGTSTLRNSLTKLNMSLQLLGKADINRIPEHERETWGNYYSEHPQVMAVRRLQPI